MTDRYSLAIGAMVALGLYELSPSHGERLGRYPSQPALPRPTLPLVDERASVGGRVSDQEPEAVGQRIFIHFFFT